MSISELKLKSQWHCESNFADGFIFYTISRPYNRPAVVSAKCQSNKLPTCLRYCLFKYSKFKQSNYYSCQLCQLLYIIESKFQRPIIGGIDIEGIYFIL